MVMGFRERRLGCRLYVDRQSDANILKKLDRMLVDGRFPNQTELIKRGIELAYEEVYGEAEEVKASHRQEIDVKKLAEEVARALKPEMEMLMAECEARVAAIIECLVCILSRRTMHFLRRILMFVSVGLI